MEISQLATLSGHEGPVYTLEKGAKDRTAFSAGSDKIIVLWDLDKHHAISAVATLPAVIYTIKYIDSEDLLLAGTSANQVHIIKLKERKEIKVFKLDGPVFSFSYSEEHNKIFASTSTGKLYIWTFDSLLLIDQIILGKGKIRAMELDIKNNLLYAGTNEGEVVVYSISDLQFKYRIKVDNAPVTSLLVAGDSIFAGTKSALIKKFKNAPALEEYLSIPAHNYSVYGLLSIQNKILSCSRDRTMKFWSMDLEPLIRLGSDENPGHKYSVNSILSISENEFISAGDDKKIIIWKLNNL